MERMEGTALSSGLAQGVAEVVGYELQRTLTAVTFGTPDSILRAEVDEECERMDGALEKSKRDLDTFATIVHDKPPLAAAVEVLSVHARMASEIAGSVKERISSSLSLQSKVRPDIESQRQIYAQMAAGLGDRPLVIRTFDLGGEKLPPFLSHDSHIAPTSLNLRGLRFSLVEQDLFREQLTAIVQIAQTADVRILFPMVIRGYDFAQAIRIVEEVMNDCDALKRPQIGAMIETPAALFCLDEILELADFIAIGTNDLTPYLLAADRESSAENDQFTAMHPAVLRDINQIVVAAQRWDCPVCVCGEEAGEPEFAKLLIGLGVHELSLSVSRASTMQSAISKMDVAVARELAKRAMACRSPHEVRELLSHSGSAIPMFTEEHPLPYLEGSTS